MILSRMMEVFTKLLFSVVFYGLFPMKNWYENIVEDFHQRLLNIYWRISPINFWLE